MGCGWDGGNDGMSLVHHWEPLGTDLEGSLLPPRAQVRVRLGDRGRDARVRAHVLQVSNSEAGATMLIFFFFSCGVDFS